MRFIIGFGTGRCGSNSFSALMGAQKGAVGVHELQALPWSPDYRQYTNLLTRLEGFKQDIACDAGFYWLNYVEKAIYDFPDVKCVCLKRDRKDFIEALMRYSYGPDGVNFWTKPDSEYWDDNRCFSGSWPQYDMPKEMAIKRYWEDYLLRVLCLERQYPDNIKIFPGFDVLNLSEVQGEMFDFIGIKDPVMMQGIRGEEKVNHGG